MIFLENILFLEVGHFLTFISGTFKSFWSIFWRLWRLTKIKMWTYYVKGLLADLFKPLPSKRYSHKTMPFLLNWELLREFYATIMPRPWQPTFCRCSRAVQPIRKCHESQVSGIGTIVILNDPAPSLNEVSRDKKSASVRQADGPTSFNPIWPRQKICSSTTKNRLVCGSPYTEQWTEALSSLSPCL